jgi:hemerythrin HHE cation binding domain-containing protein
LTQELATKVEQQHGTAHPEVHKINQALATISAELKHYFFCEENMLFPYIVQLERKQRPRLPTIFDNIQRPVTRMVMEHTQTGDELRILREITNDYLPPNDACTTYRALYRAIEDLERDLHRHIHLENNVLFPRAPGDRFHCKRNALHASSGNFPWCVEPDWHLSQRAPGNLSPAWLQAHGQAQIFGWIGSFILGIGFYSLTKIQSTLTFPVRTGWTVWPLWTLGVALRWTSCVTGFHWRVLLPLSGWLELAAFAMFYCSVRRWRFRRHSRTY